MLCKTVDKLYTLKERLFLLRRVAACFLLLASVFGITETGKKHQASSSTTETRRNIKKNTEQRPVTFSCGMQLE